MGLIQVLWCCAIAMVFLLASPPPGYTQGAHLPQSPLQPTSADCQRLHAEFTRIYQGQARATRSCFEGPSNIGPGDFVTYSCARRALSHRAWPQCADAQHLQCRTRQRREAEFSTCMSRARSTPSQRSFLTDTGSTIGQYMTAYEKTQSVLTDPKAFFRQAGAQAVLEAVFPAGSPARYDIANEVLSYAHGAASEGLRSTRNPTIRAIQQESLDQVAGMLGDTLKQLDSVVLSIESFSADADQRWRALAAPAVQPGPSPANPPGYVPESSACRVLGTC